MRINRNNLWERWLNNELNILDDLKKAVMKVNEKIPEKVPETPESMAQFIASLKEFNFTPTEFSAMASMLNLIVIEIELTRARKS